MPGHKLAALPAALRPARLPPAPPAVLKRVCGAVDEQEAQESVSQMQPGSGVPGDAFLTPSRRTVGGSAIPTLADRSAGPASAPRARLPPRLFPPRRRVPRGPHHGGSAVCRPLAHVRRPARAVCAVAHAAAAAGAPHPCLRGSGAFLCAGHWVSSIVSLL